MAISPPSDIVLDVANAASRADVEAARAELMAKTRAAVASRASGAADFPATRPLPVAAAISSKSEDPQRTAFVKFEAMMLQSFMQSMMPEEAESVYGEGLAGDMWKSFLSRELGQAIADRGGIGIAERMLPDFYREGDRTVPLSGIDRSAGKAAIDEQARLSDALVEKLQRATMRSLIGTEAVESTGVTVAPKPLPKPL